MDKEIGQKSIRKGNDEGENSTIKDEGKGRKTMTFDHVTLHPDQQIGQHSQQTWELSYIIKGSGESLIGSIRENFGRGDAALIVPGTPHQWYFDMADVDENGNIENITITFSTEMLRSLTQAMPEYEPMVAWYESLGTSLRFSKKESETIGKTLSQMESFSSPSSSSSLGSPYHCIPLLLQLLALIYEHHHLTTIGSKIISNDSLSESRIKKIKVFLTCNYQRKVNLEDLAKHVGMNRSSMCTYFKQKTGKTIFHYLIDLRISIAQQLLSSPDLSIAQCCYKCGFNDIPHFNRTFKRWVGMTPNEYRSQKLTGK